MNKNDFARTLLLENILKRENNNFDLIRLIAAFAVIYGHSFALIKNVHTSDMLQRLTGIYSAEWGVKTFFFLSGLFVVNSVRGGEGAIAFLIKRFLRIWPALFIVSFACAFIIGPLCTNLSIPDYFRNYQVYHYVMNMSLFKTWGTQALGYYNLPGVFAENTFKYTVNAPLWTIGVMAFSYLFILAIHLVGGFHRRIAIILFIAIMLDTFLQTRYIFFWIPLNNNDFSPMPFCFAVGGILAIYKDSLRIPLTVPLGLMLLCLLFKGWVHHRYLIYTFFFMTSVYIASIPFVVKFKKIPDLSYGVFLWGWPVQQTIAHFVPNIGFYPYLLVCLILSLLLAYICWVLIEKPALDLGHFLVSHVPKRLTRLGR